MAEQLITVKAYWQNTFVAELTGSELDVAQFSYEMLTQYECTSIRIKYHTEDYSPFSFQLDN